VTPVVEKITNRRRTEEAGTFGPQKKGPGKRDFPRIGRSWSFSGAWGAVLKVRRVEIEAPIGVS
jgi:hypothetical protein